MTELRSGRLAANAMPKGMCPDRPLVLISAIICVKKRRTIGCSLFELGDITTELLPGGRGRLRIFRVKRTT